MASYELCATCGKHDDTRFCPGCGKRFCGFCYAHQCPTPPHLSSSQPDPKGVTPEWKQKLSNIPEPDPKDAEYKLPPQGFVRNLRDTIDQLRARVQELEAEVKRLKGDAK